MEMVNFIMAWILLPMILLVMAGILAILMLFAAEQSMDVVDEFRARYKRFKWK